LKYFERRRRTKLYRQWVERAGLPPDATQSETGKSEDLQHPVGEPEDTVPANDDFPIIHIKKDNQIATHPDVAGDMMAEINRRQPHLPKLYILLGVAVIIVLVAFVLLVVSYC